MKDIQTATESQLVEAVISVLAQTASSYKGRVVYSPCFYTGIREEGLEICNMLEFCVTDYHTTLDGITSKYNGKPPKPMVRSSLISDLANGKNVNEQFSIKMETLWHTYPNICLGEILMNLTEM